MTTGCCINCGHAFQVGELVPLYEDHRGDPRRFLLACRRCISRHLRQGFLLLPFADRKAAAENA